MQKFLQPLYSAIRCRLNHHWKKPTVTSVEDGTEIEHICLKCGKKTKRFIPSYSAMILAENPTAYYRMNETSGNIAHDSSGNGYDATLTGTETIE